MMNFLERILRMPRVVLTVMALLLVAGGFSYVSLPKESFPAIDIPYFYVSVSQTGVSPGDAERLLAPPFAEAVRKTQAPFLQAIFDLAVPTMAVGRVALLGDAAFVARPHVGMGVTKAAGDAVALVRCLAEAGDIDRGLAAYDHDRRPYGMRVIRRARHLGAYLQAQLHSPEERARAEAHRSPEAVMTETAVMAGIDSW